MQISGRVAVHGERLSGLASVGEATRPGDEHIRSGQRGPRCLSYLKVTSAGAAWRESRQSGLLLARARISSLRRSRGTKRCIFPLGVLGSVSTT